MYTRKGIAGSNPALSAKLRLTDFVLSKLRLAGQVLNVVVMWFVYVLKSLSADFVYVGSTNDLDRRLEEHNDGLSQSTKAYRPFKIQAFIAVETEIKARELERYFKTGSGKAILKKRILLTTNPEKV